MVSIQRQLVSIIETAKCILLVHLPDIVGENVYSINQK